MKNWIIAFSVILSILTAAKTQTSAEEVCACVNKGNNAMHFTIDPGNCRVSDQIICWESPTITPGSLDRKARNLALIMARSEFINDFPLNVLEYLACSAEDSTSATFTVQGTAPGEVIGFMGDESINASYAYYIAIQRGNAGLDPISMIGSRGTLVYQRNGRTIYFVGVVTQFGLAARNSSETIYVARLEPAYAALKRSSGYAIFQQKTLQDIIEQILDSGGISNVLYLLTGAYHLMEFEMMCAESPAVFSDRLMEREGVHYHFVQGPAGETMKIGDTNTNFTSTGLSLIYRGHLHNPRPVGEFIASFHQKTSLFTGTSAVAGYDFKSPSANIYATVSRAGGIGEKFDYAADITESDAAEGRAGVNEDREFLSRRQCMGVSNAGGLKAGHTFSLADQSGAGFSDTYLITEVRHLALRVRVLDEMADRGGPRKIWSRGMSDRVGFEQLYIAALRSVGVPARLGGDSRAHFWDGVEWQGAPRPFSEVLAQQK